MPYKHVVYKHKTVYLSFFKVILYKIVYGTKWREQIISELEPQKG